MSSSMAMILVFAFAFISSVCGEATRVNFPSFSAQDNIIAFGDAGYNPVNRSYIINAGARDHSGTGTCGELLYGKNVRIQDTVTGEVASFSTSFSFTFTTFGLVYDNSSNPRDGSGFAFAFLQSSFLQTMQDLVTQMGRNGGCQSPRSGELALNPPGFALYIDTDYNPKHNEPSNNFIRIAKNLDYEYDVAAYSHNLCGNHTTHCCYFSNGSVFTAWIDFSSSSETLEVRLANGSELRGVPKPSQPLLLIPNYKLSKDLTDDVYLTFWGSSDVNHVEAHELLSWSFYSSGVSHSIPSSQMLVHHFSKAKNWVPGVTIAVFGALLTLAVLKTISWIARPSRTARSFPVGQREFSYKELRNATENFAVKNVLGSGGSGTVYRGTLSDRGRLVAVKQIKLISQAAESAFHAEVSSLSQIRHRNVVQLQGWCQEKGPSELLLVYDYMSNGSLNEWLHKQHRGSVLPLHLRQSILGGVAAALEYLHEDCHTVVLHRDIKSSNVLLDAEFKAHLGDFGLARLMDHHKIDKTTLAAGTIGYMAPEMPYTGKATKESDVYSFGILVLEVVCGKRPLNLQSVEPEDLVLLHSVWRAHEGGSILNAIDPRLLSETFQSSHGESIVSCDEEGPGFVSYTNKPRIDSIDLHKAMFVNLLHLGLLCCLPNPKLRPAMGQVNYILQQIRDMENASTIISMPSLPATKPLGLYRSLEFSQTSLSSSSGPPISSPQALSK